MPARHKRHLRDPVVGAAANLTHVFIGFNDGTVELWSRHALADKKVSVAWRKCLDGCFT